MQAAQAHTQVGVREVDWLAVAKGVIIILFMLVCFGIGGAMDYQDYTNQIESSGGVAD